jgi:hypothetical protein
VRVPEVVNVRVPVMVNHGVPVGACVREGEGCLRQGLRRNESGFNNETRRVDDTLRAPSKRTVETDVIPGIFLLILGLRLSSAPQPLSSLETTLVSHAAMESAGVGLFGKGSRAVVH